MARRSRLKGRVCRVREQIAPEPSNSGHHDPMPPAPLPAHESERLLALHRLSILDTPAEREFDALVHAAALVCGTPISLISLVEEDRQWFKANFGLHGVTETSRDVSFCAHAIVDDAVLEVPDACADERFRTNPLVTGSPDIRFYAGAPLQLSTGERVGTLCVIDRVPRHLTASQREILSQLANVAVKAFESRRLARALAESEARFRALSDAAPLGVFATDTGGDCTYSNARWQEIFGLSGTEYLGAGWAKSLHPEDRASVWAEWQRAAMLRISFDMQFRLQRADGAVVHVRSVAREVLGDDGSVAGFVGSVEDISDRVRAQRALLDERQRLAAILDGTGAGTWEWNLRTGETRINARWAEIAGFSAEELAPVTARTLTERMQPDDLERATRELVRHCGGESDLYECEFRIRHRDGQWVWVHDRGRVVTRTAAGDPEWVFGTSLDITPRKVQDEALRKTAELLNRTGALADVGGWELDLAGSDLVWSDQTCRIHGLAPGYRPTLEEAINFYAPSARPVILAAVQQAMKSGSGWDLELPLVQANGIDIWVRAVGYAEFENGAPVRLLGAFQDITERVRQRQALEAAHERMALATDSGGIGVWDFECASGSLRWDPRVFQLYGVTDEQTVETYDFWVSRVHPEDRDSADAAVRDALSGARPFDTEFRVLLEDGTVRHLRATARVTRDETGVAIRMVGANWDVSALRQLSAQLREQHELLRVTMHSIGDAVITTDATGTVTWLNPTASRFTGWPVSDAMGRPLADVFRLVGTETRETGPLGDGGGTALPVFDGLKHSSVLVSRHGSEYGIEETSAPIQNERGEVLGAVLVFRDVTEQRQMSEEMQFRATHDALTGFVNRQEFETRLRRTLERARTEGSEHAVLMIDLDQFKLVNDACGHAVGDQLLQQVARLLAETVRTRDTLARLGGDEFAVILEHCSAEKAQAVAQKICDRMSEFRFVHESRSFRIGASIGLAPVDERWLATPALMQAADMACFAAKEGGRNRVHVWFEADAATLARRGEIRWATRLNQAVDENRFELYAQRIEPATGASNGIRAEVLLRLRNPDGELILPGAFLPAAERFHLASRIDRWVLRETLAHLAVVPAATKLDSLSVNVSGQSVGDLAFHQYVIETLSAAGEALCRRLCLEITETVAVGNVAEAARFIARVRALGVCVALDDFGSGASSFGYLKSLQVDEIKIDGQFVTGIVDDPLDDVTVRSFVDVARVIGVRTIAECVETPAAAARLREVGVDYLQGYLVHRPEPLRVVLGLPDQSEHRHSETRGGERGRVRRQTVRRPTADAS